MKINNNGGEKVKLDNSVDVIYEDIVSYGKGLMRILLRDRTTNKNIIWATNDYMKKEDYLANSEIMIDVITGCNGKVIQPRITKKQEKQEKQENQANQTNRTNGTRERAEVFTPSWICNEQNILYLHKICNRYMLWLMNCSYKKKAFLQ